MNVLNSKVTKILNECKHKYIHSKCKNIFQRVNYYW